MQIDINKSRLEMEQTFQDLYEKAKTIVKGDACMKFYIAVRPLYLKNDE